MKEIDSGAKSKKLSRGYLFQRGKNYYVRFKIKGKQFCKVLQDDKGEPVTEYRKAEKAKEKLLAPYSLRDKQDLTEQILASIKSDDEKILVAAKEADNILNPALTFSKAWETYLNNQKRPQSGDRTLKDYEGYFNKFYTWIKENKPALLRLKDITEETASEYSIYLKRSKLSAGSFNKNRDFLKIFFHYLKDKTKIELNPFEGITRIKDEPKSRRELTQDEIKVILEKAEGDLKLLLGLGVFTGLRFGDCCTLQWHEINLAEGVIRRIANKTGGKALTIGITDILLNKLRETPTRDRKGYLFPALAEKYNDVNKRPMITRVIQEHFKACGIRTQKEGTGEGSKKRAVLEVGFHSLRHSYISILAKQGISQNVLVKLAGHSSKMSEHYTHIQPEEAHAISQNAFKGFLISPAPATITVQPITEPTEAEKRIVKALEYVRTAGITEADKQNLLNILGE